MAHAAHTSESVSHPVLTTEERAKTEETISCTGHSAATMQKQQQEQQERAATVPQTPQGPEARHQVLATITAAEEADEEALSTPPGMEKAECPPTPWPFDPVTPTKTFRRRSLPGAQPSVLQEPRAAAPRRVLDLDDQRLADAAARQHDIATSNAGLPHVCPHWQQYYLKILLVGESGVGKTTFARNVFGSFARDADFPVADASSGPDARAVFHESPEDLCTEMVIQDDDQHVCWHYLVQDTPGYGDFDGLEGAEEQRRSVLAHIHSCSKKFYQQETSPDRVVPLQAIPDSRVDVCLYFLPPHRLNATDLRFIQELSLRVPVVPVLAKADALTPPELIAFRNAVREAVHCQSPVSATANSNSQKWRFSFDALQAAGAHPLQGPPFAIVTAETLDRSVAHYWPVRRYPWGRAEPMLKAHSQLPVLRRLLFETGYWELKAHTEMEYLRFRERELGEVKDTASVKPSPDGLLRPLVRLLTMVTVTVGLTTLLQRYPYTSSTTQVYGHQDKSVKSAKNATHEAMAMVGNAINKSRAGPNMVESAGAADSTASSNVGTPAGPQRKKVQRESFWKLWE